MIMWCMLCYCMLSVVICVLHCVMWVDVYDYAVYVCPAVALACGMCALCLICCCIV